jgi:F-type H+-transporting ATPase subunit b
MRRFAILLLVLMVPALAFAQHETTATTATTHTETAHAEAGHGEGGGEHHEEQATWLGMPAWPFRAVNMILFFALLWKLLHRPIKNALAARHAKILAEAEEARARRAKADQLASDIEARLKQIEADVRSIHERAQADGERQKRDLIAAAEAEAQKILAAARNEVDNRLKHARQELTEYAGQLAADRAEQIVREKITDADRSKIFADSVREVGQA